MDETEDENEDDISGEYSAFSSSTIAWFSYDRDDELLTVGFNSGGSYEYSGVPEDVVRDFISAASKGKYHARYIKNEFRYKKA